eukprot:5410663-Pyramimonas_sp.AAC.1
MGPAWVSCPKVDVAKNGVVDALRHCDCFGRYGSGGSLRDVNVADGSSFARGHLSSRIDGPCDCGPIACPTG